MNDMGFRGTAGECSLSRARAGAIASRHLLERRLNKRVHGRGMAFLLVRLLPNFSHTHIQSNQVVVDSHPVSFRAYPIHKDGYTIER